MIPFQKVFTLMLRSFSKPVLAYLRKQQQGRPMGWMGKFFVVVGRQSQRFDHWLNLKVMQTTQKKTMAELKPEILMEKGIETVTELIFYSIVFGIPLWELYKGAVSAKSKERKMEQKVESLQTAFSQTNQRVQMMLDGVKQKAKERQSIIASSQKKWEEIQAKREKKRYNMWLEQSDSDTISSQKSATANDEAEPSAIS